MQGRIGLRMTLIAALVIGFHVFCVGAAQAHHLNLSAEAVCTDTGLPQINFTASSWSDGKQGSNKQIDIKINGVTVKSGEFKTPLFQVSGSAAAPSGSSATVMAIAVAEWGDGFGGGQSASVTVVIPTDCGLPGLGRFTGGGNSIRLSDGIRITDGLTIHCDLLLSNNLEINWPGGHNFHMQEHLETLECSDSPDIIQAPPAAPLDTMRGVGKGKYDNQDGYSVEFTLVDAGEPGSLDKIALKIYKTSDPGIVVLFLPLQFVNGGNLQAHFDQPHK